METTMMAACGLDCTACEIRRAPTDAQAAQVVVDWLKSQGWLTPDEGMAEVLERRIYCCGCLGDRTTHWSADCWILACCVDQRGLTDCSQCVAFPCQRLEAWATQNAGYGAALERLRDIRLRRVLP